MPSRGRCRRASTRPTTTSSTALSAAVTAARGAMPEPSWREIGVLTRDNSHAADVFDALTRHEIPVEIVGLKGLLRLPEVAEVVATLTLVQDVTANASLLTLLAGPRWAIGTRDLALLGQRAADLSGHRGRVSYDDIRAELDAAVSGSDPAEVASLGDALESPGDLPYSPEARARFALLAAELRRLRSAVGEPILDLVRRIIDTCGIDVELASSASPAASARRDNLDLFVRPSLSSRPSTVRSRWRRCWPGSRPRTASARGSTSPRRPRPTPSSCSPSTVPRAWSGTSCSSRESCERKFPTDRTRATWLTVPFVMPAPLRGDAARPAGPGRPRPPRTSRRSCAATKDHEPDRGAPARPTSPGPAPATGSGSPARTSGPTSKTARGPSVYLEATVRAARRPRRGARAVVRPAGEGRAQPLRRARPRPALADVRPHRRGRAATRRRRAGGRSGRRPGRRHPVVRPHRRHGRAGTHPGVGRRARRGWSRRRAATGRPVVDVPLPSSLSATALARLRDDPDGFAADLARPMPRQPSPAARFGTRFHAWVESRFGQQDLFDPDDLPGSRRRRHRRRRRPRRS